MTAALIIQADARHIPMPDASVDLVIISPPYYSQRSYQDGGQHYDGQIGSEPTPEEFLEGLFAVMREVWRVLKPKGSCVVNLGDKRSGSRAPGTTSGLTGNKPRSLDPASKGNQPVQGERSQIRGTYSAAALGRAKSKMLLPHEFARGCRDGLADPCVKDHEHVGRHPAYIESEMCRGIGWLVRQDQVWWKANGMPESVRDRTRDQHEYWFHFTKQGDYYSAMDEVREPHAREWDAESAGGSRHGDRGGAGQVLGREDDPHGGMRDTEPNPLGRAPSSVWKIATEPLQVPEWLGVQHFAAFPSEWPRRYITGWSPKDICTVCGEGRWPVTERELKVLRTQNRTRGFIDGEEPEGNRRGMNADGAPVGSTVATIVGYACSCTPRTSLRGARGDWKEGREESADHGTLDGWSEPGARAPRRDPDPVETLEWQYDLASWTPPPSRPGVVLDVFGGSGTTAMVARALGRIGVSLDLSYDYCRLARWRVFDSGHGAKIAAKRNQDLQGTLGL